MNDERSSKETVLRRALWWGVGVLAVLGVVSAVGRAVSVASGGLSYEQVVRLMPSQLVGEAFEFDRWFVAHPALTLAHVVPGGIFLALAPFQFSTRIRSRYVRFHRWSGRVLLVAALPVGLSGLVLGAVFPYGGPVAAAAVFVAGATFLFALVRAFDAIRRGDVARHREWMIRMFSLGLAIGTIRVVGLMLFPLNRIGFQDTHVGFHESAGTVFWIGWASTFAVAEMWIRRTRPRPAAARVAPVRAAGA
jgi:uncharacterized membrane protein